jgi:hypothetical protein
MSTAAMLTGRPRLPPLAGSTELVAAARRPEPGRLGGTPMACGTEPVPGTVTEPLLCPGATSGSTPLSGAVEVPELNGSSGIEGTASVSGEPAREPAAEPECFDVAVAWWWWPALDALLLDW